MKTDNPRCCGVILGEYNRYQCSKPATTTHAGKPYCKTHNPAKWSKVEATDKLVKLACDLLADNAKAKPLIAIIKGGA